MYNDLAKRIEDRYQTLKGLRTPWESLWSEIARYVMPRRSPGLNGTIQTPNATGDVQLFDTTAVRANMTLANGQLAWMSPLESAWFAFEPRPGQGDDARRWLTKATVAARDELAISNFYTAVHEFYLDRGAFGTACLYLEGGRRSLINAQAWPVGSFVVDEDENGMVDTVIREFTLTPRQAAQKFGEENLSEKVRNAARDGSAKSQDKIKFLHAIYPREDAERDHAKLDAPNMPIASVYLELAGCHVCKVSGYEEMPVMVSRYLEWGSGMGGLYGWSPSFAALPEARQLNFLQKMMDALAEKMAFPPVLAPEELEGEIDPNAMGVTYFSRDLVQGGSLPKEWMTQGRYDIGLQRVQERQRAINDAFHVDLFQMFAQLQKQMTAREVSERAQEKLIQFSPTFSRLTSELFNPLLERVFGILLRAGRLGEVPMSMVQRMSETTGFVPTPKVQYSSRIALALRSLPSLGYQRTLERLGMVAGVAPQVLDNFDFDKAERDTALSDGMPADYLLPESDVAEAREARAQQQAQMQQQAAAMQAAEAVSKVGSVPADSPIGQAIQEQMPTQ
jgi:hypothetical protein